MACYRSDPGPSPLSIASSELMLSSLPVTSSEPGPSPLSMASDQRRRPSLSLSSHRSSQLRPSLASHESLSLLSSSSEIDIEVNGTLHQECSPSILASTPGSFSYAEKRAWYAMPVHASRISINNQLQRLGINFSGGSRGVGRVRPNPPFLPPL